MWETALKYWFHPQIFWFIMYEVVLKNLLFLSYFNIVMWFWWAARFQNHYIRLLECSIYVTAMVHWGSFQWINCTAVTPCGPSQNFSEDRNTLLVTGARATGAYRGLPLSDVTVGLLVFVLPAVTQILLTERKERKWSHSVISDSLQPHGL